MSKLTGWDAAFEAAHGKRPPAYVSDEEASRWPMYLSGSRTELTPANIKRLLATRAALLDALEALPSHPCGMMTEQARAKHKATCSACKLRALAARIRTGE